MRSIAQRCRAGRSEHAKKCGRGALTMLGMNVLGLVWDTTLYDGDMPVGGVVLLIIVFSMEGTIFPYDFLQ